VGGQDALERGAGAFGAFASLGGQPVLRQIDVRPWVRLRSKAPRADKHTGMPRARSGPSSRLRTGLAALVLLALAAWPPAGLRWHGRSPRKTRVTL
jgi:hypothetical protein